MIIYRVLSALLSYPEQELIDALPEIEAALEPTPRVRAQLSPLIEHLRTTKLIRLPTSSQGSKPWLWYSRSRSSSASPRSRLSPWMCSNRYSD